jgi:hypothetical protein
MKRMLAVISQVFPAVTNDFLFHPLQRMEGKGNHGLVTADTTLGIQEPVILGEPQVKGKPMTGSLIKDNSRVLEAPSLWDSCHYDD